MAAARSPAAPCALLPAAAAGRPGGGWLLFERPAEVVEARRPEEVRSVLEQVEATTAAGRHAAGFVAYEAAAAFDPACVVRLPEEQPPEGLPSGGLPLAWFALFGEPEALDELPGAGAAPPALDWRPALTAAEHAAAVAAIHRAIERGDVYQVNFTFPLEALLAEALDGAPDAAAAGDPLALFAALARLQPGPSAAYLDTGRWALCSASPELFFERRGERLRCRPMKGTAARGRTTAEDRRAAAWLAASAKNRAENVMIVDMVRNDLGRVAAPGSVRVERLCAVEKYETVYQLTSTVEARSAATLAEVFTALFPPASITGTPKLRAMELIAALEGRPRGVYTGAIGYAGPGGLARFNVAIRTVVWDRRRRRAVYGTGGGIVWDSRAADEYRECRTKARLLFRSRPEFALLETLRWRPGDGYCLLGRHLERLADSAEYFDFALDPAAVTEQLARLAAGLPPRPHRVRLLLERSGAVRVESRPLERLELPRRLAVAARPIDSRDPLLFHKTTLRRTYREARAAFPRHHDVLLWNRRGEATESTVANLVARLDGRLVTPPVDCGLLPGTLRADLLARGLLTERRLPLADLERAEGLYLISSLRGWLPAALDRATLAAAGGRLTARATARAGRRNPSAAAP